jgi:prolipoprotein diacylglyceryl transferase
VLLASFPSPSRSVWDLGPIPIRAYALCIILGIVASIWIGERRWVERGGKRGTVSDVAVWAVIFGLIGGRLYHVITDNELYFRAGRDPWRAFYVWEGGLGVWGAIALGGVGAWIGCHRRGIKLPPFADAVAPGIAVAQGIGRWGNYFNQELFGRPTNLPWAVQIDPDRPSTVPGATTYQPTFLYESLWDLALAAVLIVVDRRFRLGRGRVFALYVMGYCAGRIWIEALRIDTANHILGLRLNIWTSIIVFAGGLLYFLLHRGPRETVVEPGMVPVGPAGTAVGDTDTDPAKPAADADPAKPGADADASEDADEPVEPDDDEEPAAEPEPATPTAVDAEPSATTEPATEPEPVDAAPAAAAIEPTAATEPTAAIEPTAATEPTAQAEPTAEAESAAEAEPTDDAAPADATDPADEAEPADEAVRADEAGAQAAGDEDGAGQPARSGWRALTRRR